MYVLFYLFIRFILFFIITFVSHTSSVLICSVLFLSQEPLHKRRSFYIGHISQTDHSCHHMMLTESLFFQQTFSSSIYHMF